MADKPYQREEWLRREYVDKGRTVKDIAEQFDMSRPGITHWMDKYGIDRRGHKEAQKPDKPYTDEDWLRQQYINKERSLHDIAAECGVSAAVILKWARRFEIPRRGAGEHQKRARATYTTTPRGYRRVQSRHESGIDYVYVHQLLAIAKGYDPHVVFDGDYHTHHRNGIRWDNRPENIELLHKSEHLAEHAPKRDRAATGEFV